MNTRLSLVSLMIGIVSVAGESLPLPNGREPDLHSVTTHPTPEHAPILLAENGKPAATVYVMENHPRSVVWTMARQLVEHIKLATGAQLPLVFPAKRGAPPVVGDGPAIIIGDCPEAAQQGVVGTTMPAEGFAIKTAKNRIYIVGRRHSTKLDGTAWGITEFLERFVGVRWLYPAQPETGLSIPMINRLIIPPVHLSDAPAFTVRTIWPDWSNSWRGTGLNLGHLHQFLRSGTSYPHTIIVHSPRWDQVPEFRRERPELYQQKANGERQWMMLCYGHPRTLTTYVECIDRWFSATPAERNAQKLYRYIGITNDTISVSPADMEINCFCSYCQKLWDPDGGTMGTASRIVTTFVSKLGAIVKQRWPDKTILYGPYLNHTLAPDGIDQLPDNVIVQPLSMPGMALHAQEAILKADQANFDRWVSLCGGKKLPYWGYSCWPADRTQVPYQYPYVIQQHYVHNREKLAGTFINGLTDHWPRFNLSLYVWMKCLWDPDYNVDAAITMFCKRMFGPAAATMRNVLDIQISRWQDVQWPGGQLTGKSAFELSFSPQYREQLETLLATAREQVNASPIHTQRLAYYTAALDTYIEASKARSSGILKPLVIHETTAPLTIDGKLDEPVWSQATKNTFVMAYPAKKGVPQYTTTLQAVWDAEGVTFGFQLAEPTPELLCTVHGSRDNPEIWWDDNVEMFIDVTGKQEGDYYQFIINPKQIVFDARTGDIAWNATDLRHGVHVGSDHWNVEVTVPFAAFPDAVRPTAGTAVRWHGNFTRHRVADRRRGSLPAGATPAPNSRSESQRMNTTSADFNSAQEAFAELIFISGD